MSAARADRTHAQQVELVLEIQTGLVDAQTFDRSGDARVKHACRYAVAGCDWLSTNVPGAARVLTLFGGAVDELRAYGAIDALRDRKVAEALADAKVLAGMLDGVEERVPA
jgi:hypothetical protein